ncbi:MAG: prolipoprotein diacylglyceryl transferase family protein, partial [Patescibacteria group bacterium]
IVSRIVFIIFNTDLYFYQFEFKNFLNLFTIWDKGLSFWGAIFGWILGMLYVARKWNESPMKLLDTMMPAILLGLVFGDIGALLDGINYGTPTTLPWGVTFRSANVKYVTAIHPTQIYGFLYTLLLAGGLYCLYNHLRGRLPGFISELALLTFSLFRFLEEFVRGDETIKILGLRVPQMAAFLGVIAGIYLIHTRYTNKTGGDPERVLKRFVSRFFSKKQKTLDSEEMAAGTSFLPDQAV